MCEAGQEVTTQRATAGSWPAKADARLRDDDVQLFCGCWWGPAGSWGAPASAVSRARVAS